MRLRPFSPAGWFAGALLCALPGAAQPGPHKFGPVELSGSWRLRVEGWDWFDADQGDGEYAFPHSLVRAAVRQQAGRFEWQVEAAQIAILGLPEEAVVPGPQGQLGLGGTYFAAGGSGRNHASGFVKQAWLRFRPVERASLRLGRFEFLDGAEAAPKDATVAELVQTRIAQRLIGNFGWAAVGRSYDGAHFAYNFAGGNVTFVAARPTRGVFQTDAMGELDAEVYYGALTAPLKSAHRPGRVRLFGLGYIDRRSGVLKTDSRPPAVRALDHTHIQIGTFGADYIQAADTAALGKFDVVLWGAVQTGTWGLLEHRAGAFAGELGWQPRIRSLKPWLSAGYSYGSGDGNPNDTRHSTFFQVLPTPRPYARFPFYNMENNQDFYAALQLRPHARLALRSELHALRLSSARDLWYQGGGAFQPGTFGYAGRPSNGRRSLANVWDLSADCRMTRALGISLYYGHAWGKGVIAAVYPQDPGGQFAYLETNLRF